MSRPARRFRWRPGCSANPTLIELAGVEKVYRMGKLDFPALRGVGLSIAEAENVLTALAGTIEPAGLAVGWVVSRDDPASVRARP